MPRATEKTKPVTIYPSHDLAERIAALAGQEGRSVNSQVLVMLRRAPELQEEPDGA